MTRAFQASFVLALIASPAFAQFAGPDYELEATLVSTWSLDDPVAGGGPSPRVAVPNAIYSNVFDTGEATQGAITNGITNTVAGNGITAYLMDDINMNMSLLVGSNVKRFYFSVANLNSTTVSARPRVRFWFDNGAASGVSGTNNPSTYYGPPSIGFTFGAIAFAPNSANQFFTDVAAGVFPVLNAGHFWAGWQYDNNTGATGATLAQLGGLGQLIRNPVDVGSSADAIFIGTNANSLFNINYPAIPANGQVRDSGFLKLAGAANLAMAFTPEPATMALLSLGAVALLRRRR